jgi:hypothetical protein
MFKLYIPSTHKQNPFPQHLLKTKIQEIKRNQFNLQSLQTAVSLYYNCCIHWKVIKLTAIYTAVKSLGLGHWILQVGKFRQSNGSCILCKENSSKRQQEYFESTICLKKMVTSGAQHCNYGILFNHSCSFTIPQSFNLQPLLVDLTKSTPHATLASHPCITAQYV